MSLAWRWPIDERIFGGLAILWKLTRWHRPHQQLNAVLKGCSASCLLSIIICCKSALILRQTINNILHQHHTSLCRNTCHLSLVPPLIPSLTMVLDIWDTFLHCCWLILIIKIRHYNSQNTSLLWCSLFCSDDAWYKVLCPCVRTDWAPSLPPQVPVLSSVWRPLEPPPPANTPHPPRARSRPYLESC